jgi:hypothetical protein
MEQTLVVGMSESKLEESWSRWAGKTLGILVLTVPVLTVNGFLAEVAQLKASLSPYQTLVIDWDVVPGALLRLGLVNLVGFPVIFFIGAAIIFAAARALGGKGSFWHHSHEIAVAYLKVAGLAVVVFGLMSLTTLAGILGLAIPAALLKFVNEAIANVHGLSAGRGCVAMLSLIVVPILIVVVLGLLVG